MRPQLHREGIGMIIMIYIKNFCQHFQLQVLVGYKIHVPFKKVKQMHDQTAVMNMIKAHIPSLMPVFREFTWTF